MTRSQAHKRAADALIKKQKYMSSQDIWVHCDTVTNNTDVSSLQTAESSASTNSLPVILKIKKNKKEKPSDSDPQELLFQFKRACALTDQLYCQTLPQHYQTIWQIVHDLQLINEMNVSEKKTEAICDLFTKMLQSPVFTMLENKKFLITVTTKLIDFANRDYNHFSRFLMPMFEHVHTVCYRLLNSVNRSYVNANLSDETYSSQIENILINALCRSKKSDTLYNDVVTSLLYVGEIIELSRYKKVILSMLCKLFIFTF